MHLCIISPQNPPKVDIQIPKNSNKWSPGGHFTPQPPTGFGLEQYDLNHLFGNNSILSDRLLANFKDCEQFCLKKFKGRYCFLVLCFRAENDFRNFTQALDAFSDYPVAPPHVFIHQVLYSIIAILVLCFLARLYFPAPQLYLKN